MKRWLPIVLILIAILTVGLAGDWIVDTVSIGERFSQGAASSTNSVMGSLGIGTATPEAKLHVVGPSKLEGTLDLVSNRVMNIAQPESDGDAVSKGYVHALLEHIPPSGGISMGIYTNR